MAGMTSSVSKIGAAAVCQPVLSDWHRISWAAHGYLSKSRSAGLRRRHENARHRRSLRRTQPQGWRSPWAGDFRLATDSQHIKSPVGKTLTLEMPDGRTGKVVVQGVKGGAKGTILALMGEDMPPF